MIKIFSMQSTEKLNVKLTLYTVSLHSSLSFRIELVIER